MTELHRLAVGNIAEKAVCLPLDTLFKGKNINLRIGTVSAIDPEARKVVLDDGTSYAYDALVLALGNETNFHDIPGRGKIASR